MVMDWTDTLPTVTGPRVQLRWIREEDAAALLAIFGDPEVMAFWSSEPWPDLETAQAYIRDIHQGFHSRSLFQWAVTCGETGELIGTCTLAHYSEQNRRAEVGIILGRKSWGQGLGRSTLRCLIRFAFEELGLERLEADIDPNNLRSLALFEGRGFQREGLLRERWRVHGEVQDTVLLGLLRREWTST